MQENTLNIFGARAHNLQNINLSIPRDQLVVITGLSGSGKSSLAFDTIYAEGQRRYMESFSAYARQFIGNMERPDVDKIDGLSPVISIEQKTTNKNPRSTVGTITEIYDYLRLLYARIGEAYSYISGEKMVKYSEQQIVDLLEKHYTNKGIVILAPLIVGRKGHYRDLFESIRKQGFLKVRIDGKVREIAEGMSLNRYQTHDIEMVIDKLIVDKTSEPRLIKSVQTALKHGKGILLILDLNSQEVKHYSRLLMCPTSGISYPEPEPNTFSFNSPYGACETCNGIGIQKIVNIEKLIPYKEKSIRNGGLLPLNSTEKSSWKNDKLGVTWINKQLEIIAQKYDFDLSTPIANIPKEALDAILYGVDDTFETKNEYLGVTKKQKICFDGLVHIIQKLNEEGIPSIQKWTEQFMEIKECPSCKGTKLKTIALHFRINGKNIAELSAMNLSDLHTWISELEPSLSKKQKLIGHEIIKEIQNRIDFLQSVGIGYLSLNRPSNTLSGGESQRIRLATQIGSKLVGVLYILDEPSIGLHQRDNHKLIQALKTLRDMGNSVIVVEHDRDMMLAADYIVDIGPGAGIHGGKITGLGTPSDFLKCQSLTADFLTSRKRIEIPSHRRKGNGKSILLKGASGNNLKKVNLRLPLACFICVTGVSGSGKSSLINHTLHPILSQHFYRSNKKPLPYISLDGLDNIDKVIEVDQGPIGRTPRSNPATYVGVFDDIRKLFASLPDAKIRGYEAGRFSFNIKGGRCESCGGAGVQTIEMNFLPDVYIHCEECNGKRYNRETLDIRYKGKSINDVLNMSVQQALDFFENIPHIIQKLKAINEVGLGYITLGQSSPTLSGGEAQRIKLASELYKKDTGNTLYILDEPTTGLHFEDIRILLGVLQKLVDQGNTVLVIEHNMDVIKSADYIIDIGPEGGKEGGYIVAEGTPEAICKKEESYTGQFLKEELAY
ncbi:MAG: excinuclease ABC subunit UvrA [Bacteroidales bacterium]